MNSITEVQQQSYAVKPSNVREAVGIFLSSEELEKAIVELDSHFPRHSISVIGGQKEIEEKFGQPIIPSKVSDDFENVPLQAPLRSEEKVIGLSALVGTSAYVGAVTLALAAGAVSMPAIILAAVIGGSGGAAISGILAKILGDNYHKDIEDQIENGGLMLWVNTLNSEQDNIACEILTRHGAMHVRLIEHTSQDSISN